MNHRLRNEPSASADEMISTHGAHIRRHRTVLRRGYAPLFDGLSPLDFRIILAPVELGPYLGVSLPTDVWPTQKRWSYRLTEVEAYRWPHTFRKLIADGDRRLQAA